jgi:hypothetical protein
MHRKANRRSGRDCLAAFLIACGSCPVAMRVLWIMVSLIPGATCRFRGHDLNAEAGKTIDVPDVTIPRP